MRFSFNTYALFIIRLHGFGAAIFLIVWNYFEYRLRFLKCLTDAACGAGIIKARKMIEKCNVTLLSFVFITILISTTFQLLHVFKANTPMSKDTIDYVPVVPTVLLIITTIFALVAQTNAMSVVYIHFAVICAEYDKLAFEFREDVNTFQLPVVTHYAHAHHNIWRLWTVINRVMR
ncbi:unnamed protein product [Bursaphelenchus okinawaensis]|uniref:Uncharacterized protein n=1 Tax=Bursaphelenchus okinawaensis TaxID=465554 RepID=A0A811KNE8_9BILA|nr:unnamed protein product [Bursaphelenchus okinawaensis]CAG9106691.1 unnamed protein product [Bursaphelenchus okinawaensis]